ncbi:uncharacterized protein TNCV_3587001 [Trichonephila clavipes]|nr:uncharacterized protein TNCV_3587001 [Trichonephila clavipes]
MEVTRVEQRAYIKIAVLQGSNSPYDFDLIPKVKKPIRGRRFATLEDFANAVPDSQMVRQMLRLMVFSAFHSTCRQRVMTVAGAYIDGL